MFTKYFSHRFSGILSCFVFVLSLLVFGCQKGPNDPQLGGSSALDKSSHSANHNALSFTQVNLVANASGYAPRRVDENLLNAWGIAVNPTGKIWIAANHSSVSVVYDTGGNALRTPVTIPAKDSTPSGAPTGVIFNSTTGFVIPATGEISNFIFASEDGVISAWSSGSAAVVVANRSSADAVYKGLALAWDGSHPFIYATNFKGGTVDVFDDHFQLVSTKPFTDSGIPDGFAPFGIQNMSGNLFVTYALHKAPDNQDDQSGPGNGYIDVYRPDGTLISRFASQGTLNSPWGMAKLPDEGFGKFEHAIAVGNFGDGRINLFDGKGKFLGQISDTAENAVTIKGLWALAIIGGGSEDMGDVRKSDHHDSVDDGGDHHDGNGDHGDDHGDDDGKGDHSGHHDGHDKNNHSIRLYFTAGPNEENDGLFGYLQSNK